MKSIGRYCCFAASVLVGNMICDYSMVSAVDYISPVNLTVQTKEVNISEIPEDRNIRMEIYFDECTDFMDMTLIVQKDSRLSYNGYDLCTTPVSHIARFDFGNVDSDTISVGMISTYEEGLNFSGTAVTINVTLPENVNPGDFYNLNILSTYPSDSTIESFLCTARTVDEPFRYGAFASITNGGILIVDDTPHEVPQQEPIAAQVPETEWVEPAHQEENQEQYTENPGKNDVVSETTADTTVITATDTVTSAYTSETTFISSTAKNTTSVVSDKVQETTESVTTIEITSPVTTVTDETPENKENSKDSKSIIIAAVIVALSAVIITLIQKLRNRK